MLNADEGRFTTLLGHRPDDAGRPLRRDSGRRPDACKLALSAMSSPRDGPFERPQQ